MKKFILPVICLLGSAALLSGCGEKTDPTFAMNTVLDMDIALLDGGSPLYPEDAITISATDQSPAFVVVATKWVVGDTTVTLNWDIPEEDPAIYKVTQSDDFHKLIEFNFPEYGGTALTYSFELTSMSCQKKTMELDGDYVFDCTIEPRTLQYDEYKVSELVSCDNEGHYGIVDYNHMDQDGTKVSPYFAENYGQPYKYVTVKGKLTYVAPDGNWGLLADGDSYIEIYAGSGTAFTQKNFSAAKAGNWVEVRGNMAIYQGNFQIGYVNSIRQIQKGTLTEPTAATQLTASEISTIGKKQNVSKLMNQVRYVEGTFVAKTLKDKDGKLNNGNKYYTSIDAVGSRWTFTLKVGTQQIIVAYDYHVHTNGSPDKDPLVKKLNECIKNNTKTFRITGTMRYNGTGIYDPAKSSPSATSYWSITPMTASDVVAK